MKPFSRSEWHTLLRVVITSILLCPLLCSQQPGSGQTASALCDRAYASGKYREAATCFANAAVAGRADPSRAAKALQMEARSLLRLNDLPSAEAALRASLEARPQDPDTLYLLGSTLQRRNLPKESLETFTAAAKLRQPTGEDLRVIALDYVLLNSYPDALHWLARAVAFSPSNADAWYDLGRAQMHEGRFADAAAALRKSLQLQPLSAKAEDNLGICLEAENQPDAAVEAYTRAVKLAEADERAGEQPFVDYGALLNTRNGFREAIGPLQQATKRNPQSSRAFAELSRAYTGLGENTSALTAMQRAVALDEKNSRLHFQLGRLYRAAGMATEAKREFELSSGLYGGKSAE